MECGCFFASRPLIICTYPHFSTPLYQVLTHALSKPENKTKFTLIYSNVTEADILMREEIEQLKKKHPNNFEVVYYLDSADKSWKGVRSVNNFCLLVTNNLV